jgi:hypothetical protein
MKKFHLDQESKRRTLIAEVAEILATGILRIHLRDVRAGLISSAPPENCLEVSFGKSLHRLELEQRGKRR